MGLPARPLRRATAGLVLAAGVLYGACGFEGVASGPADTPTTGADDPGDASHVEDASAIDGDASQGACPADRTVCGTECTDLKADPRNCGACGKACDVGQTCNEGTCDVLCVGDTLRCDGRCIDPTSDPKNCKTCGTTCGPAEVCLEGACGANCAPLMRCNALDAGLGPTAADYCANTVTDRNNCGVCGKKCLANEVCEASACKAVCATGATIGEIVGPKMVGCLRPNTTWDNRANACPAGVSVCKASQWAARLAPKKPAFNYWTDDYLQYSGKASDCSVVPEGQGGACYGYPMRVCAATTDGVGNKCNWINCDYGGTNQYFGGCQYNYYAGSLCCAP